MRPSLTSVLAWFAFFVLTAAAAEAATFRSGDAVRLAADETIDDDLYVSGGTLDVEGTVDGDLVVAGGTVNISGEVTGALIVAGGTVNVTGQVGRSVRALGGTLTFSGEIGEDLVAAGGSISVNRGGEVGRDFVQAGGRATMSGVVGRNVMARSGELTLAGEVGGDVRAWAETLRISDGARIDGGVTYTSEAEAQIDPGATIAGGVEQREPPAVPAVGPAGMLFRWARLFVGFFALGAIFLLLAPGFAQETVVALRERPWGNLGVGTLVALLTPLALTVVFMVGLAVGGWWIAAIGAGAFLLLMVLGTIVSALTAARVVLDRSASQPWSLWWALFLGLVVLTLVRYVPVLGWVAMIAAAFFGSGALIQAASRLRRGAPPEEPAPRVSRPLVPAEQG